MDFHALSRRDLQALAKRNGIRANMTNGAMADALAALPAVDGIEEYVQQPVAEPTPAAEPVVQPTAEEEEEEQEAPTAEKQEISRPGRRRVAHVPDEVIMLDDSEEEKDLTPDEDEEKAPAHGVGRRRVAWAEPVAATVTRKRAATRKANTAEAVAEAVPARATRARSQRTVESAAEEEAPKTRRTSTRAAGRKSGTQQEEEEKGTQGDVSDMEATMAAAPAEEQSQEDEGETEKEAVAAEAVPARATRARRQRMVLSVAEEDAPKTRRTSRKTVAKKNSTEQEDEEKATQGDVSDMEVAVPAPVSSDDGGDGPEEIEEAMDTQNQEQNAPAEEQRQEDEGETEKEAAAAEVVPARATRARRQRTAVSAAAEDAPKARRTTRRAVATKTGTEQEEEEKGTQESGDVPDMGAAVPAPVSADEGSHDAEDMEADMDAHKEEFVAAEAVPVPTTRARRQRTVAPVAEDEAPKARRTSRRASRRETGMQQEEEEKRTHGDVSDEVTAVTAPVSSDEGGEGAEDMEADMSAQNEEQSAATEAETGNAAAEPVPARTTRARSQRTVVSIAEEEAPKGRRTSRRAAARKTGMEQEDEEKRAHGDSSDVDAAVLAPVTSEEEAAGSEEMDAAMDAQNEEQNKPVEEPIQEDEGETGRSLECSSNLRTPMSVVKADTPTARRTDAMHEQEEQQYIVSDVETAVPAPASSDEEGDGAEEIEACMDAENEEQNAAVETQNQQDEGVVADIQAPVVEDCMVDSSVEEQTDTVSSEEIQHSCEDAEMVPVEEATVEVDFSSDVSEENQDCTAEEEPPVEEVVDSSAEEEPLVDVQQCEATEVIHLCEERCVATVNEVLQATMTSGEATEDIGFTSDVEHTSEENEDCKVEEELPMAEDDQQCETAEEIQPASEDKEMLPVNEVLQAMQKSCTSDADEENEEFEEEPTLAEHVESSVQEQLVDVQQCGATEEIQLDSEDTEMVPVPEPGEATEEVDCTSDADEENEEFEEEPTLAEHVESSVQEQLVDVQQCGATEEIQLDSEDTEMVPVPEPGEATEEVDFTSNVVHASEENEVPTPEVVLQSAAKANEKEEDVAADELTNDIAMAAEPATDEMPQMPEAMDECVAEVVTIDYLSQATITDDVVKESGFTADLTDVSIIEEAAEAADEMPLSLAGMDEYKEEVATVDYLSQATDVFVEEMGVVAVERMTQSSATEEKPEEVVAVDIQSQATVTDDEGAVKESGFTGELADVSIEEQGVVAADEMLQSSAIVEGDVEEVVSVYNLSQATVAVEKLVTVEQAKVTNDEWAVNESAAAGGRTPLVYTARDFTDFMASPLSASVMESDVAGGRTPAVVATGRNFSDHITSPWSANVFEYATKSLSINSITAKPMVAAPADVPMSMYSSSGGKKDASEPVAVQRHSEVKEPEAAFGKIIYSPLTVRKLRRAVAEENEADGVPPCIFINSSGGEENSAEPVLVEREKEVNEPEAAFGKTIYSPLTIRKLRRAVAEENEADGVPPCIFINSSGGEENSAEPVLVEREKEVNEPEAAFGKTIYSPITIRKPVAEENEADGVPPCIFINSSGGEENSAEPVLVEREKEVNEPEAAFGKTIYSPLTIRKLRRAVEEENEADGVPPCIFISSSGGVENSAQPVLVQREALGSLSLRKLRTEFNQIVAVAQENEVKEGEKSSLPLDKLSLRKLTTKLKETLNAHKNTEPKRVPLGRLDENAC